MCIASLYVIQARYDQAEPLYKRSLAIREKWSGPDSIHITANLENYAALLKATKRTDEAEEMLKRAAAIRKTHAEKP